jgi:glycosyltransferase involved in cell wall biosynthesis
MGSKDKTNLMVVGSSLDVGGAETVIANLCRYLNQKLFNVTVCHLKERGKIGKQLEEEKYDVIGIERSHHKKTDYLTFIKLRRILQAKKIDIIHTHTLYSLVDSSLCKLTTPGIRSVHTFHFGNYPHMAKKYLFLERMFWRVPDKVVSVGHEQGNTIKKTYGIPDGRMVTIWNGVAQGQKPDESILSEIAINRKTIIGSISTFIEQKGLTYLLDVAYSLKKKRNDFVMLVVGDGQLKDELVAKSRILGLDDCVIFLGRIENAAERVLPYFDIFIQTSLWEAMSIVILEAMAYGKPVVATSVGDNGLIIEEGKTGFLVEPKDVDKTVLVLDRLLDQPELREIIGKNAIQKYHNELSVEIMAKRYESLYMEVLDH